MGNLLTHSESLAWEDRQIDRGDSIMKLNSAILKAREQNHSIYSTPELMNLQLSWGSFFQFVWVRGRDDAERAALFPWLTQIQYDTLCRILYSIGPPTPQPSTNLEELEVEFVGQNNGLLGIEISQLHNKYVCDIKSLHHWNSCFLKLHPENIDWENCVHEYFPQLDETKKILEKEVATHCIKEEIAKFRKKYNNDIELIFYEEVMKKKSTEDRIAYAETIGSLIADINFYHYEEALSKEESDMTKKKRRLFSIIKNLRKIYLSIDFEKGMYEVIGDDGKHLGEYRFCGTLNKFADKIGNHDLYSV